MQTFENGSGNLKTHDANVRAFEEVFFRPRHGVYCAERDLSTTVLGHAVKVPLIASSIGALGVGHPDAETGVTRAIGAAGGIQFVSGFTTVAIEQIMGAASGPIYFQPYFCGTGAEGLKATIERAKNAGCDGLVFVIDSVVGQVPPRRLAPGTPRLTDGRIALRDAPRLAGQLVTRPGWTADYLRKRVAVRAPMALDRHGARVPLAFALEHVYDRWFDWNDLDWIREIWDCPIVIKGALSVTDAQRAVECGALGVVVSNHGGNRLDGTIPTLPQLPQIAAAVGSKIDVLIDSGVRTGPDVIKAIALGAKAVGLGRAYLYPFLAAGQQGVARILEVFRQEMDATLAYLGCRSLGELGPEHLALPARMT